jgi:hypothetical protein
LGCLATPTSSPSSPKEREREREKKRKIYIPEFAQGLLANIISACTITTESEIAKAFSLCQSIPPFYQQRNSRKSNFIQEF